MLAPVTDAIQRFRRRLRLATFVRAVSVASFAAMVVVAGVLLFERFADTQILTSLPWWGVWCGIAAVGLLAGFVLMRRTAFDDATVAQHLEQRLATNGLLLTASQGVALDASYQSQLTKRLTHTDTVLPAIRWQHLLMRPMAAAVLVIVVQYLPSEITQQSSNEALEVAVERLKDEVEQVAQLESVPDEQVDELRAAVTELEERVATADNGLWREIDQLQERIDREEKLAAGDDGGAGGGNGESESDDESAGDSNGSQQPFDRAQLAAAMSKLGKMDKQGKLDGALLGKVMDALPGTIDDAAKQAIAEAVQEDGSVAPEALPEDPEALAALSEALAETAEQLGGESEALAEMAAGMSEEQVDAMADELAALAEQFDAGASDPDAPDAGAPDLGKQEEQLKADISEDLAKTAAEMAKAGALDKLPEGLREAMVEAGLSALENMDLQKLMSLLPEDLSQLTVMAENLAKAAEGMSGEQGSEAGEAGGPQPSEALKTKMGELAKGLMEKVGRQAAQMQGQPGGQQPGGQQPGGQQPGGQQPGGQQPGGQLSGGQMSGGRQPGVGTEGGGHAALRLTEDTQGGLGKVDVELPGRDPDDLPKEWVPVTIDKAKPEVGEAHAPGVGRAGATGRGTATWQLRLMPRHRDVVRRFFAEKNKKNK